MKINSNQLKRSLVCVQNVMNYYTQIGNNKDENRLEYAKKKEFTIVFVEIPRDFARVKSQTK